MKDRSGIPLTRRELVVTTLATGFAAAVRPVSARTRIRTAATGLVAGEVKIPTADGSIPAYRARPRRGTAWPVVLVVPEIFGVHEYIKDVARRLAKLGYFAVAPEPFARQGGTTHLTSIDAIRPVVAKVPDAQVMSDLDATVAWAKGQGADTGKLAITGFCWGGRVVWLYAAHNRALKAGIAWYGRLEAEPHPLRPKNPIDLVKQIDAPVLGLYGGADRGIPNASVERMRAALKAAGKRSEIVLYPGAPHAFHADYRPSYREAPATDGWKRMLAWLARHGVGPKG